MPSWSWLSTYGRIHYDAPTLSGNLARSMSSDDTASVSIVDKRLHIYAQAFEYGKLDGPFILQIPDEEKVYQARTTQQVVFIQDKVRTYMGEQPTIFSRVGIQHFYGVHSEGGAAVGWISFDTGSSRLSAAAKAEKSCSPSYTRAAVTMAASFSGYGW